MLSIYDPYQTNTQSNPIEIDLRAELYKTINGATDEISKKRIGIIRIMRKDTAGNLIRCACRNGITDEPSRDSYCRYCLGMGYVWDEYEVRYYKNDNAYSREPGMVQEFPSNYFYLEYSHVISPSDYIIEINTDINGSPVKPYSYLALYNILSAENFRLDNGRIEYWRLRAKYERDWSVNYGVKNRQYP